MSFLVLLFRLLSLTPIVVAGVESLHAEASGATKKQLAMDTLDVASAIAGAALPGSQAAVSAMTSAVGGMIDNTVSIFNAAGIFGHKATGTAAAPAPVKV